VKLGVSCFHQDPTWVLGHLILKFKNLQHKKYYSVHNSS
jgi:hypothetical protein